jgi:hypothetical protein
LELGGSEESGDVLVTSGGAAAAEIVIGEEGHVGADLAVEGGWCCLNLARVEGLGGFCRL